MTPDPTEVDPQDMLGTVEDSPSQWEKALALVRDADLPGRRDASTVIVAGMGGSGISGDLAAALAASRGATPIVPVKGYDLPRWADGDTLVVAVSHSGDTEETVSLVEGALDRGLETQVVTSGGRLAALAEQQGLPAVRIGGEGQPRAALPFLATATLGVLDVAGVLPGTLDLVDDVPDELRRQRADWGRRPATLARSLAGAVPLFLAGHGLPAVVALRARCQVEENAKRPAFAYELPEADHNALVGWAAARQPVEAYAVIAIEDPDQHPRLAARFPPTLQAIAAAGGVIGRVHLDGPTPLARALAGIYLLDLVSVHLAIQDGIDPTPVEVLVELKERLREERA